MHPFALYHTLPSWPEIQAYLMPIQESELPINQPKTPCRSKHVLCFNARAGDSLPKVLFSTIFKASIGHFPFVQSQKSTDFYRAPREYNTSRASIRSYINSQKLAHILHYKLALDFPTGSPHTQRERYSRRPTT